MSVIDKRDRWAVNSIDEPQPVPGAKVQGAIMAITGGILRGDREGLMTAIQSCGMLLLLTGEKHNGEALMLAAHHDQKDGDDNFSRVRKLMIEFMFSDPSEKEGETPDLTLVKGGLP